MKTLDFSCYRRGVLSNDEDAAAREMLQQIVTALLEDGRVRIYDPHDALHSRVKYPFWNIRFCVNAWMYNYLGVDWEDHQLPENWVILNWLDDHHIFGWYDMDAYDTLKKGYMQFVHPTADAIKALWAETAGRR